MCKTLTLFALIGAYFASCQTANILCMFTSHSPSHVILHMSYARALVERGHNVTVITAVRLKDNNPSFHHIYIPPTEERIKATAELKSQMARPTANNFLTFIKVGISFAEPEYEVMKDQRFQDFLHNPDNTFDLVIIGFMFSAPQFGLGLHFNCPIILSWVFSPSYYVNHYIGNPREISYVPDAPLPVLAKRGFIGRLANFMVGLITNGVALVNEQKFEGFYRDIFPAPKYPPMEVAKKKVSLVLCTSHLTDGLIRPNVPALIEVGGIQVKDKADPLPKNLQQIFDVSSKHGVIFVSFGTNIGSNDVNPETFEIIFKVLASMKQTIIWKWDSEEKPGNASNIHFENWLPQDDILAQSNLKLFITHAGKGSVTESTFHGVPMVSIPLFSDQPANALHVVNKGFGLMVDHETMTEDSFKSTVLEVLENPLYSENVKRFSNLYRDRPMTAKETAVYWIEYVIRHKGAYHMQSPLVHLNAWQYLSLDVIAFFLVVVFLLYKSMKIAVKYLWKAVSKLRDLGNQKIKVQRLTE